MTHHDAFLADILQHPEDDAPRLVYADWLEEHGGEAERAEFIRVQCELARDPDRERACREACKPPAFEGCPQGALRRRERELLSWRVNQWIWLPDGARCVSDVGAIPTVGVEVLRPVRLMMRQTFRRGFVDEIHAPPLALWGVDSVLPAAVAQHPIRLARATDQEPMCRDGGYRWVSSYGRSIESASAPHMVPPDVFDRLDLGQTPERWLDTYRNYPTPEEAHAALSAATLALARQRAEERRRAGKVCR